MNSEKAISLIAINIHSIPDLFRPETIEASEAAKPARMESEGFRREDWRSIPLVTIDPPDAKDHDDAVFAQPDGAPDNPEGFVVTVAIADVCYYVRPGAALDREALDRGNSVYFPDRVVPMLPERISNDLCSLRQGEDRPALAVRMRIGKDGHKLDHRFFRVMMRSAAKLSYQQAQDAIDGRPTRRPASARQCAAPAVARLRGGRRPRKTLAARSRPARAQDHLKPGWHGGPGVGRRRASTRTR